MLDIGKKAQRGWGRQWCSKKRARLTQPHCLGGGLRASGALHACLFPLLHLWRCREWPQLTGSSSSILLLPDPCPSRFQCCQNHHHQNDILPAAPTAMPTLTQLDLHFLWFLEHLWSCSWAGSALRKTKTLQAICFMWWKPGELRGGTDMVLNGSARYINKETEQRNFWTTS